VLTVRIRSGTRLAEEPAGPKPVGAHSPDPGTFAGVEPLESVRELAPRTGASGRPAGTLPGLAASRVLAGWPSASGVGGRRGRGKATGWILAEG